jgi:RNA polymerase sigma factor (sigma-70 family)
MSNIVNGIDITQHLGLAHLACKASKALVGRGFDYDDLFQAACEGLIYAAETFDASKGQFSTYAVPMAKKFVKRLVTTQSRTVKCPEYAQDRAAAAGKVVRPEPENPRPRRTSGGPFDWSAPGASATGGRPVSDPQVRAGYQGVPSTWTTPQLEGIHAPSAERSFDYTFGEDGDSTLHDVLADETSPSPEDLVAARERIDWETSPAFQAALATLNVKERAVMVGRLAGKTQPGLATELGLTKARVQQIEAAASRKMADAMAA